ncbi:MAG: hypothetical protein LH632_11930, partial [Rhodoferax sp.]|nr:hypothetical protein [Rhodoferax sp.]
MGAALLFHGFVVAQGNSATMAAPVPVVDPCKRDVLKYQANIDLVRKSLGDKAAAELEARFMGKAQWDALLLREGYCGIARLLREQK